jgi:manganese-dependent inorganic pyrophosphatase
VAARCGDTNERIDFVLRTFGVEPPRFVADVAPRVRDVMQTEVDSVTPDATAADALGLMDENRVRIVPVIDENGCCRGLLSLYKLTQFLFPGIHRLADSRRVLSSVDNLARTLGAKVLLSHDSNREEDLILMIGAMSNDSFAGRLKHYPAERLAVLVGDRADIQELAVRAGARVLIVTGGLEVPANILSLADNRKVCVLSSPHDTATTSALSRVSVTVRNILNEEFMTFSEDGNLDISRKVAASSGYQIFPVLNKQGKAVGLVSKSDFLKSSPRRLILVDHNELSQAVEGAEEAEILEIIDHHRIGALTTNQPILFRNEPLGSTSTIVADCFFQAGVAMPKSIAGLLLAGLISDTLNLTSPTSTSRDATVLRRLESISGVKASEFKDKFFASGSFLTSKSPAEAIQADCKEYAEGRVKFSVAQIEEVGFEHFWNSQEQLISALEAFRRDHEHFFSALMVTDVTRQGSLLIVAGSRDFLARIKYPEARPGIFQMDAVVSRKKQLLPYLVHCLMEMERR